ncbi:hypothetical protein STRCI_001248 [Streptomyces cinnabarinus]|uniref:Uncharacterized protein n=1 Tax=Streptomyces cinnabarinus TaxID=67287 RepID=A0ABY7KB43_9ACTN|nr:hypothetical protein [Streptomyces cinnabarinus]WAZ20149.1 hypothetical protein STRCI_001248 [Streptomyces cinnabarinus]
MTIAWSGDARLGCSYLSRSDEVLIDSAVRQLAEGKSPTCRSHRIDFLDDTEVHELWVTEHLFISAWAQGPLLRVRNVADSREDDETYWPAVPSPPPLDSALTRSANTAIGVAARIAGRARSHLHREWVTILQGMPEEGITFSPRRQLVLALGFLLAAARLRSHDGVRPLWRPVDWLLRVPSRANGLIATVIGAQAIYIVGDDGLGALATSVWEPCGIAAAALYALVRWLRRVRGIELATVERLQASSQTE